MRHPLRLFRSRLALRAAASIVVIVGVLGVAFLLSAVHLRAESEKRIQQMRLEGLISTVERTAQIACFLEDTQLAGEVTQGLLSNSIVREARLVRPDGHALSDHANANEHKSGQPLTRAIHSPFEPEREVCRMTLVPDQDWIDDRVNDASRFLSVALTLQLLGIGLSVILVVFYFVTRPISDISQKLHALEAETGQKLSAPGGHYRDEIGRLVASVNAMIDRLVTSLGEERRQRLAREIEQRRYRNLFENVEAGIFELDDQGRLLSANPAFCRLFLNGETPDPAGDPIVFTTLVNEGGGRPFRRSPPGERVGTVPASGRWPWVTARRGAGSTSWSALWRRDGCRAWPTTSPSVAASPRPQNSWP